ncbi:MAG: hydroxymethylglutaryl-CoA reductase, degradative [Ardenticatenia bacterium]|nr:hydroxymethylglutaryl-CoA reductase, degradative [Ardenticatenia bacterium]
MVTRGEVPDKGPFRGFYRLSLEERVRRLARFARLSDDEVALLRTCLDVGVADRMIENVVGLYALPLGLAVNFVVNGRELVVPMAVEEPSVVAACSYAAKLARLGGGFHAHADSSLMIGQIQVLDVPDVEAAARAIVDARQELLGRVNELHPTIVRLGGGAREIQVRRVSETPVGPMLVVHLLVDTRDAMGANAVNTACEALAPHIARLTGGRVNLRILSNLADRRLARARAVWTRQALASTGVDPDELIQHIVEAWAFAAADPYRAATHNKGIMNGVDAVAVATGNDWRAIEAGAHAYAARHGRYTALTRFRRTAEGNLEGTIELPLAVGTVGGATKVHPVARLSLRILGVQGARDLAAIMAAVGLAQNFAALRALAAEGIQRGHMRLHARQVALAAGATGDLADRLADRLAAEGDVRVERARRLLREWQTGVTSP